MNILVVDDSSTMRSVIRRDIESLKLGRVIEAGDGEEALSALDQFHVDLVISDWNMPRMDGLELLHALRKRNPDLPLIMVTTEAERCQVVKAIQEGVSDYLLKPFDSALLQHKLLKWCCKLSYYSSGPRTAALA